MITDRIIKKQFIVKTLRRDMVNIYDAMTLIARQNIYHEGRGRRETRREGSLIRRRTGALLDSLEKKDFDITFDDDRFLVSSRFVKHLRFLDMKLHGDWKIYNRQVWGILYNNAIPDIRYNTGMALSDRIGDSLREAFSVYLAPQGATKPGKTAGADPKAYARAKGRG